MTVSGSPTETDGDPAWRPGGDEPSGLKDRVLRMASGYTRTQKIVAGVAVLGVVLGVVLVSKMTGGSDWAPLYTDLSPADGNAIVGALPGTDATDLALPSGTYQAFGLYEVTLKEVQRADGAEARSDAVTVVSDPVDVVIDGSVG